MVAIVAGSGLGLDLTSLMALGSRGQLGDPSFGRYGENVTVNAANGNLVIGRVDEVLTGQGPSDIVARTYNSLSNSTGYGANNGWQTNDARAVWGLSGTVDTAGSSVNRTDADGSVETYNWNASLNAYVSTETGLAENRLTFSSTNNTWSFVDGKTQATEVYDAANGGRIVSATDANGNALSYSYTGTLLTQVTTADGEYTQLIYSGNNLAEVTTYLSGGATQSRVYYTYDSQNRLSTVTTDLTPADNSISDGNVVVTTYGYDGTSDRVTSISQTGGAQLQIAYTQVNGSYCVSSLTQTTSTGVTSTTAFSYNTANRVTTITDNAGNVTSLGYDALGELTSVQLPPAQSGATAETLSYTYNSDGDVLTATDGSGNKTTYTYDSNDNLTTLTDPIGNVTTYTYDANNHVLTATTASPPSNPLLAGNESIVVCNVNDTTTFDPRNNDADTPGATITITAVGTTSHGTATIVNNGTAIQYTRTSAGADSFSYTVQDSQGNTNTAQITVSDSTTQSGQAPTAGNVSAQVVGVGTPLTFDPRADCSDVNGYALTITAVSSPSFGTATINSNGTAITYTRTGSGADSFTYTVSDNHGHTATATVSISDAAPPVNQPPSAGNLSITVGGVTSALTFDPRAVCSDVNGYPLTITAVSTPAEGTATIINGGTAITYSRTASGADSFTYTVSDGHGRTATATVSVADGPAPSSSGPVAGTVRINATQGLHLTFDPRAYCSDVNNYALTITAITAPSYGTASIINSGTAIQYVCNTTGNDSFTYTVSDGHGKTATATITIRTTGSNSQLMTAVGDAIADPSIGNSTTFDPRTNDTNFLAQTLTVTAVGTATHGTVAILNSGTQIKYTRTSGGADSFTYTISDQSGHTATATVTVGSATATQTVVANNVSAVLPGSSGTVTLSPLTVAANTLAYPLTITTHGSPLFGTASIVNGGTQILYTRTAAGNDSFTYKVSDGHGTTATATVTISSGIAVTQVLTATNDAVVVNAVGDSETFDPTLNDANLLAYAMTITAVGTPSHGTATLSNGKIVYTRTSAGNDSFTYTVSDGHGNTATATVSVSGASSAPTAGTPQIATARYVYDANENLRFVVDGDGQVTEYRYNGFGEETSSITYTDNAYSLTGLASNQAPTLSQMTTWVSGISTLATIKRVDTTYDFRGNVATITSYTACDPSSGAGLTTQPYTVVTFTYDPSGKLLSRQTSGESNSEVFQYDGLWRTTYAVDLNGGTTTIQYNDAQNTSTVTLASGMTVASTYDLAGRLISTTNSGTNVTTGTATYKYDGLGNLAMVTDADGNSSYFLFDTLGRKVASIAADGSIVEYRYDQSNRLVATIAYATKLTANQMASLVNTGGNPVDPALSTVRPASNAADVWTWRIYDTDNRLVETIDGDGDATTYAYDAFSNLVSTTSYANTLGASTVAGFQTTLPTTLQLPTANPAADDVTRTFYDNEGRIVASLDAGGFLTQIVYDNAGEKIQETRFATAASASLRATGSLAQLLASVGSTAQDITTRFFYDDRGLLRYTLDANLRPTEYDYDNAGHLLTKIEYAGSIASASSYTLAYVQSQISTSGLSTNPNNRCSWSVYDSATGNLDYTIDAMGDVTQYRYDTLGHVIKLTQFATLDPVTSSPSQATMDSWASAHSTAADRISRSIYNPAGQLVYTIDGENYVTEYRYDAAGRVTLQIRYASAYVVNDSVTQSSLAALIGSPIPSTAVQTSFSYDVDGRVTDTYNGLGIDTHVAYDALGRVTDQTVAYGTSDAATTHYTYDNANRVLTETAAYGQPEAATTTYTYDGMGRVLSAKDADGNTTSYVYDADGNLLTKTDALGNVTTNTYDAFGNVLTTRDALGNTSYFFYDLLNRLTLAIDPMGYATATSYAIGNEIASVTHYATAVTGTITPGVPPTITTNAADATTSFTLDLLGRVTKITDAVGNTEQYTLDAFGDRVSVINKLGGTTTYTYDHRGLMLSETLPESSIRADGSTEATSVTNTYAYDSRGNRTQMVEASGLAEQRTTNYTYDKLDRLTGTSGDQVQVVASDLKTVTTVTPTTTIKYDNRGNVIETDDALGNRSLSFYDHLNRRIATVNALGTLSTWTYDANGNVLTSTVYGDAVALPANPGGTPPSPVNPNNDRQITYTYDKDNRLATTTYANLTTGDYVGSAYATTTGNVTTTNAYDANGNLIQQTDGRGNSIFTYYDHANRKIAQVDQDNYLTAWALDQNGNVLTETRYATQVTGTVTTAAIPSVSSNANDRITTFTYDKNGNRLTESRQNVAYNTVNGTTGALTPSSGTATITYAYNGLGEVTRKTYATGDYIAYSYDTAGRQTQVQLSPFTDLTGATVQTTTSEAYDGLNNLTRSATFDADNGNTPAHVTTYSYGAGGRLATMTDADGFTRTYGYDADGHTVKVSYIRTLSDGVTNVTEAQAYQYDATGRQTMQSVATYNGSSWTLGDQYQTQYDVYGEVSAQGVNGLNQITYSYDSAGRLTATDANDGVSKLYVYDKAGNQSLEITSSGTALPTGYSWSTLTLTQALNILTTNGANAVGGVDKSSQGLIVTITTHDGRGQALSAIQPFRQLSMNGSGGYNTQTLTTSSTYDAFGDVASQTDANGNVTNFTYSTLGKVLTQVLPSVNYTQENGAILSANPTTTYYYDLSGRVVGVKDANGNLNTRTLLANTGYDGNQESVLKEFHADGGIYQNLFDVFGNLRETVNEVGSTETMSYDAMGRLIQQNHATRPAGSIGNPGAALTLIDYYAYDQLGQRTKHWNSENGSAKETTDYDSEGRIDKQVDFDGYVTTTGYAWSASAATQGLGTFGGWIKTTLNSSGLTSTETDDIFGRRVGYTDFGGNIFGYSFDLAGRSTSADGKAMSWYNTGEMASESNSYEVTETTPGNPSEPGTTYQETFTLESTYGYDANGNRTAETLTLSDYNHLDNGGTTTTSYENATSTYDALNRLTSLNDTGYLGTTAISETWEYDLNSNIRHEHATYYTLNNNGTASTTQSDEDYWFKYDSMNRFVTTDGEFTGSRGSGTIDRGLTGTDIVYDAAGNRVQSAVTIQQGAQYHEQREFYTYTADGYLAQTTVATGTTSSTTPPPVASGPGTLQTTYIRDAMGRVTSLSEYNSAGTSVVYSKLATYDAKGQVLSDSTTTVRSDGSTWNWADTYDYDAGIYNPQTQSWVYNGAYQGGVITHYRTAVTKNGVSQPTTDTANYYSWQSTPEISSIAYTPNINTPSTQYTTVYNYAWNNLLSSVQINDGNPRTITYVSNLDGQLLSSDEALQNGTGKVQTRNYFLNDIQRGTITNDGADDNVSYSQSITDQTMVPGQGVFENGATSGVQYANFDGSYQSINGLDYQQAANSYTVVAGDTLQSISQQLYGDSSYWYLIADANGLTSSSALEAGQTLTIPNKVADAHNSSSTNVVYNPSQTIGNTAPTHPPAAHHSGCGVFGQILLAVIAIAVAVVLPEVVPGLDVLGPVLEGAVSAVAGSVVSQGVGLATGIQSQFSWTGVAEAAIGGAIGGALNTGAFGNLSGDISEAAGGGFWGSVAAGAVRGVAGDAFTQGVEVATGLQKNFNWAEVAAGGVGGGVMGGVGYEIGSQGLNVSTSANENIAVGHFVTGMAGAVANAATRSLISGTDFGDNLIKALPDAIGQTIGNAIAGGLSQSSNADGSDYQSRMDAYNQAIDSGKMSPDQLGLLYQLLGLDGGINVFDQGSGGAFSYAPQDQTQQSAYDNAFKQTGDASVASKVASVVAAKEVFDNTVSGGGVAASVQAAFTNALLSEDVYFNQSIPELLDGTGYTRVTDASALAALGVKANQFYDAKSGFYAALYENSDDGTYVLANRGTVNLADWETNITQAFGYASSQYSEGIGLANALAKNLGSDLSFTGHSLGGGLASAEAIATGLQATVFDPSGVSEATVASYGSGAVTNFQKAGNLVTAYDVNGEFLGWFDDHGGKWEVGALLGPAGLAAASQLPGTAGNVIGVPAVDQNGQSINASLPSTRVQLHSLNYVFYGLNSYYGN